MKNYEPRLKKIYREQIAPELFKEFSYSSEWKFPGWKK
jgi:large subunit ribosomal protein L5